ncbi:MAG TPA: GrpB family protein [Porphyromonadaceae bacterium]|nr:GrpB family protein [Porphyromonadaceae bacterium]
MEGNPTKPNKRLSEMTLEELWHLFPIQLVEHNSEWTSQFHEEKEHLKSILHDKKIVSISHIGSTAIKGIWSKPIVDILIEIDADENIQEVAELLVRKGYISMCSSENRISLNKGYTPEGFTDRVFHIHLRFSGDNVEIKFRNYLNTHPEIAKNYEALKLSLWKQYEFDRDGYTNAKSKFVLAVNELCKGYSGI